MKWSKILYAGLAAFLIRSAINTGFGQYFSYLYDLTSGMWRAMPTPFMTRNIIILNLILAIIAVFVYAWTNTALGKKKEVLKKGLKFGVIIFLVRDLAGSLISWVFMPVSAALVGVWLVSGLAVSMINGLVIAHIYK
ncbi:hypothetical protein GOV09_05015 [Candidatus Woesearchaeota archaeon]|nr:hypothetical protein [Candidatus Woesearchaeota archaeon]